MSAVLAAAVDRRAAEMFEEDGPIGLSQWATLSPVLRSQYRRFAEIELEAESLEWRR